MEPIVLSIGTTHPWNVAGVGRDLIVGADLGVRVFTAVAAVSAQNAGGVVAIEAVAPELFAAQLGVLPWDAAAAVRIGALPAAGAVRAVAAALRARPSLAAVVDPVVRASRGGWLADEEARAALAAELTALPNAILTPNLAEAAALLGVERIDREELGDAARQLRERGSGAVLLKGGHLAGEPADALATAEGIEIFAEARIAGNMHGTGCTLAMALACRIALGEPLAAAVRFARAYVRAQLARH